MKYTLLTGATSDIGKEIAINLSKKSALLLLGREKISLDKLISKLHQPKIHHALSLDLNEIKTIKHQVQLFLGGGGGIETFIHCAGKSNFSSIKSFEYNYALEVFNINLFSCAQIISTLLRKPNQNNLKNIIFISSISAKIGYKGTALYAASKASLDSLAKSLCDELSPKTRVNSIQLGNISTQTTSYLQDNIKSSPMGEGRPCDVANLIDFLTSDKSSWISGQNITLDGGKTSIGH